ncbi:MAG: hypothetical protein U0974_10315 [Gemmatimonadales bacterium]|nr:hypothetical protein [Gemmatimonadales bacterium]MDZ4390109.1 hypothetical protein [Gemmatimonadales bacterium]
MKLTQKPKRLANAVTLLLGVAAFTFSVAQTASAAEEQQPDPDRCSGQTLPVCRQREVCVGLGGSSVCNTDFYYFP